MSHPAPFVRIDHHDNKHDEYHYDIMFILNKRENVFLRSYPFKNAKSVVNLKEFDPILDDEDIVIEHTFDPGADKTHWEQATEDSLGGWFNSRKKAIYSKPLPVGKRLYVMTHPDSSPADKEHNGTIHWPGGN